MKMVFVVRADLGMKKGKIAAQCAHACIAAYDMSFPLKITQWKRDGQPKIAVKCADEAELLDLFAKCVAEGIAAAVVRDAGRTQIPAGSATVLGIGPHSDVDIDKITGHLKLL